MSQPAIFLDRDGTLNEDLGYTYRPESLRLLDGVWPGLELLRDLGWPLVIVTNQSGIARGFYSEAQMHGFHDHLRALLLEKSVEIAAIYHCPFLKEASIEAFRRDSLERKPHPGMLQRAARELGLDLARSYAIGDKKADAVAGQRAGCRAILLQTGCAGNDDLEDDAPFAPDFEARDLEAAARWILARETR